MQILLAYQSTKKNGFIHKMALRRIEMVGGRGDGPKDIIWSVGAAADLHQRGGFAFTFHAASTERSMIPLYTSGAVRLACLRARYAADADLLAALAS